MSALIGAGAPPVALRPSTGADAAFLRSLYLDARPELQLLPPQLVDLQIAAQRRQYDDRHRDALDEVVEVDAIAVGRCWTATRDGELHILDLSVRADRRRQGIGRAVLDLLIDRAAAQRLALTLAVWSANAGARRLYEVTGFTAAAAAGGYSLMRLDPGTRA